MTCVLCDDIAKHNMFIQLHRNRVPRAPVVGKALGVTPEQVIRHRRHINAFGIIIPIPDNNRVEKTDEKSQSSDVNPLESLQRLQSDLHSLLTVLRSRKDISAGDVVRVVSEIRSLIVASEDLQIKLAAAKGSENSAFTQSELKDAFLVIRELCPTCREKLCEHPTLNF